MNVIKRYSKKPLVKLALPFLVFVVGGSFFIREFASLRYKYNRKQKFLTEKEAEELGIEYVPEKGTLEAVYESMKDENLDTWENKRIPRLWDEGQAS